MQDQAHLVGERAATAGTIRGELSFVQLDQVLGLAAGTVDRLVNMLGRSGFETGDDEGYRAPCVVASIRAQARRCLFQDWA
jgi:hypothetical protein